MIAHGKKNYWRPDGSFHYHATLAKGENTLEASLARVLMRSVTAKRGFDADHFRAAYVNTRVHLELNKIRRSSS